MKPRLLFLFADQWDRAALAADTALHERFTVVHEGFDLFRFPECARILAFDARAWIDRMAARWRHAGVAGVVSTHEPYGALIAAILAQRLGLPGAEPAALVRAQHKFHARQVLAQALPEANPAFALLPHTLGGPGGAGTSLPYPFFAKPVKGTFSILARRVADERDLASLLTFGRFEAHLIRRLVRPFADLMPVAPDCTVDPLRMMGESLMTGVQVNVDGWFDRGAPGCFGVVDAVTYPGTDAFARFEYPSRLPAPLQARARDTAQRALQALKFTHGAYNVELFVDPVSGACRVIEVNPRFAAQFGDLYARVDGTHPYAVLADLATGRTPAWTVRAGPDRAAASFVLREFSTAPKRAPTRAERAWLAARHPGARLHTFVKRAAGRAREAKWLGSHRYAIVNMGGADRDDLARRYADILAHVRFGDDAPLAVDPQPDALPR
ncbi:MAG: ATP-grasp domain-containing protein [Burkholderiales bacterium]